MPHTPGPHSAKAEELRAATGTALVMIVTISHTGAATLDVATRAEELLDRLPFLLRNVAERVELERKAREP